MTGARLVGVISDTHGLLRPEATAALRGSDLILHAGDIGSQDLLDRLAELAPVVAVHGNCDRELARTLPAVRNVEIGALLVHVLHDLARLDLRPAAAGVAVVISGHTHHPAIRRRDGVLYVNPGSAGPRRFDLPVTVARLRVDGSAAEAEIIDLPLP